MYQIFQFNILCLWFYFMELVLVTGSFWISYYPINTEYILVWTVNYNLVCLVFNLELLSFLILYLIVFLGYPLLQKIKDFWFSWLKTDWNQWERRYIRSHTPQVTVWSDTCDRSYQWKSNLICKNQKLNLSTFSRHKHLKNVLFNTLNKKIINKQICQTMIIDLEK